jgi:hypothetical protein
MCAMALSFTAKLKQHLDAAVLTEELQIPILHPVNCMRLCEALSSSQVANASS